MWEHLSKHSDASADRARFTFCIIFSQVTLDAKTQHACMKKVNTHYTSDKTTPSLSCLTGDQTTPGTTLPVLIPRGKFLIHNATEPRLSYDTIVPSHCRTWPCRSHLSSLVNRLGWPPPSPATAGVDNITPSSAPYFTDGAAEVVEAVSRGGRKTQEPGDGQPEMEEHVQPVCAMDAMVGEWRKAV